MIRCYCIDAKGKPVLFPEAYWVKEETHYTVTWLFWDPINQNLGVQLKEIPTCDAMRPFEGFRIDRFIFNTSDLPAIVELFKACNETADVNIEELLKEKEVLCD